jgi:hypothetical protein
MRWPDDYGRTRSEFWTRIRSFSSFLTYAPKKTPKADEYRVVRNADPDLDAGSVVRCCAGIAPFYGTGARADAWIRTSVPDPRLILQAAFRTV